jgi:hypothetical protein
VLFLCVPVFLGSCVTATIPESYSTKRDGESISNDSDGVYHIDDCALSVGAGGGSNPEHEYMRLAVGAG